MKINSITHTVLIGLVALALLPVQAWGQAVDRVVGADDVATPDVRISNMGPDGDVNFDALHPAVVYNSTDQQFLVVWAGDHSTDGDVEIFGQRLDAASGERLGQVFRISDMGPGGDAAFDASTPAVAYNSTDNTYLVIWAGIDGPDGEGLFGQRLNAATGDEVGADDFRIVDALARNPAVGYNDADNEYFVVWQGQQDVDTRTAVVFGQRLNAATGNALGGDALRISPLDEAAHRPALAYNTDRNEYLVVWQAAEDMAPRALEIFGQRLNAATGALVETDFRISDMGPDGDPGFYAFEPAVVYNEVNHEYLVVWIGDDNTAGMVDNELEVFGQRLDALTGEALGNNDFRISAMGSDGDATFGAAHPDVVFNPDGGEYLVVWRGDHNRDGLVEGEHEIFGQRIFGNFEAGDERGDDDFRISTMGSDGNVGFDAIQAAVVYGKQYFAVWHGDDDAASVDNEHEIFGRYIDAGAPLQIELADFTAESDGKEVLLQWTTALEQDNVLFEVERKTTDDTFEVVGFTQDRASDARSYTYTVQGLEPGRHVFRLKHTGPGGASVFSAEIEAVVEVPGGYLLTAAYPNPFNRSTTFTLTLAEPQVVELEVYDMLGRKVATLHKGEIEAYQQRSFQFEAASLPSGSYFIRAVGETFMETKQVMLVR